MDSQQQLFSATLRPTGRSHKNKQANNTKSTHSRTHTSRNNTAPISTNRPQRRRKRRSASTVFVHEALYIIHSSRASTSTSSSSRTQKSHNISDTRSAGHNNKSSQSSKSSARRRQHPQVIARRTSSLSMHISSRHNSFCASIEIQESSQHVPVSVRASALFGNACTTTKAESKKKKKKRVHFNTAKPDIIISSSDTNLINSKDMATPDIIIPDETVTSTGNDDADASLRWYTPSEMCAFREVARATSRKAHIHELERLTGRKHTPSPPPPSTDLDNTDEEQGKVDEDDHDTYLKSRGLDYRSALERQRNRLIGIRAVLECQRRLRCGQLGGVGCDSRRQQQQSADDTSIMSPEVHLALISAKCTRWSREVAALIGRRDFYEAYPELWKDSSSNNTDKNNSNNNNNNKSSSNNPYPDISSLDHLRPFPAAVKNLKRFHNTNNKAALPPVDNGKKKNKSKRQHKDQTDQQEQEIGASSCSSKNAKRRKLQRCGSGSGSHSHTVVVR